MVDGCSALIAAHAVSPLKLLAPRSRGKSVWAFVASYGGGLVVGDATELTIRVGSEARCFVGTQASTKVYRNPTLRPCTHTTRATVADGALLVFAPDPVQAFADAAYEQHQSFDLAPDASLVLLDWFTAGRHARGERWAFRSLRSRNEVRGGAPARVRFLDALDLSGERMPIAAGARTGRYNCFATLLLVGPRVRPLTAAVLAEIDAAPVSLRPSLLISASPIEDGVVLRAAGEQAEAVGRRIHGFLSRLSPLLGDDPWQRKW